MILLEVNLPDVPGSLIELIKPISENGGNIYGILHHHDKKVNNMIPVEITFELNDEILEPSMQKIRNHLIQKQIEIIRISIDSKYKTFVFILSGHVFDTDITDTLNHLNSKKINVTELQAKFSRFEDISNVKIKVEFPHNMTYSKFIEEINKICKQKNLFLIKS
jgi:ACT domain-containing protein